MFRTRKDDFLEKLTKTLTEVEDELRCAVCLDFFRDARLIGNCGHFFCCDCIRRLGRVGDIVKCPECNRTYKIPVGDTEDLLVRVPQLGEIVTKIKSYKQLENIPPSTPDLEVNYCSQCNFPATLYCYNGMCPSCCTEINCSVHGRRSIYCPDCNDNKGSSHCSTYRCAYCCTDYNCLFHHSCLQCGQNLSQRCPYTRCDSCCHEKRCPVHSTCPDICVYGTCKNKASHACTRSMCRTCCDDPQCPSHYLIKGQCLGCHVTPTNGCSVNACGDCCTDRWCPVHGRPKLCKECINLADERCREGKCCDCCDTGFCNVHKSNEYDLQLCLRCDNQKRTFGCSYNSCRLCCKDCPVHSTSSLCTFCNNPGNKNCTQKTCKNCCKDSNCPAHGNVSLIWCTNCNTRDGDLTCPNYMCWTCCVDPYCRVHTGVRKCTQCNQKNSVKNCSMASCLECCTDRQCPTHNSMSQSWCPMCCQKRSSNCSRKNCLKCCCKDPECPLHRITKEPREYLKKPVREVNKRDLRCRGSNNFHQYYEVFPNDPKYHGKCSLCDHVSITQSFSMCTLCPTVFCNKCRNGLALLANKTK